MLFNSIEFLIFFIIVTPIYFVLPHRYRWFLLLVASCYFYMAFVPVYILILAFTIVIDYFAGIYIEKLDGKRKKILLISSIFANCGILAIFKYYNFFNDNFSGLLQIFDIQNPIPYLNIILPIGLSFHTFQAMSYTIEVYRGNQKAEKHFGIYSLYVMFYPQLVAGPIERPQNLLEQFHTKRIFNYELAKDGLRQILWGLFTKVVVADNCAPIVNKIFSSTDYASLGGVTLFFGGVFFAFQIYGDFSGYSNIAIGISKLMGFNLMVNFRTPYFSRNIAEFWKRWHISLSTWFRDYLYIPLGGSKVPKIKAIRNIFIIFIVSGFWHGANWTYIFWGLLNAIYFLPLFIFNKHKQFTDEISKDRILPTINEFFRMLWTFTLTVFAWIFFRSANITSAFSYIGNIFLNFHHGIGAIKLWMINPVMGYIFILLFFEWINRTKDHGASFQNMPVILRWGLYYSIILMLVFFGNYKEDIDFIYFQF